MRATKEIVVLLLGYALMAAAGVLVLVAAFSS